jgi:hypothetical protein
MGLVMFTFQHSPTVRTVSTANIQTVSKLDKDRSRKTLGEDVGILGCCRHMQNTNFSKSDAITNEV